MLTHQVLINGQWKDSDSTGTFQADDPKAATAIEENYPVSSWAECESALNAAQVAFAEMRKLPVEKIATFLEQFADGIEAASAEICEMA